MATTDTWSIIIFISL